MAQPLSLFLLLLSWPLGSSKTSENVYTAFGGKFGAHYDSFPDSLRLEMMEEARKMFTTGYDCYMRCAFPMDELDPIHCKGIEEIIRVTVGLETVSGESGKPCLSVATECASDKRGNVLLILHAEKHCSR